MILFDKANPLDEIAEIVRLANPGIADHLTGDDIIVDKIENVDPNKNDGFNTKGIVRTVGKLNTTLGAIPVRFNRLDLSKYIPWNMVRVPMASERGSVKPMKNELVISKALGTKFEFTGRYRDWEGYTSGFGCAKGQVVEFRMTPRAESLRYTPNQISVKCFGLGISMEHAINNPALKPFVDNRDGLIYTGAGREWWDDQPRPIDSTKRSHCATMGMLDFTSVWGERPQDVIVEHGEEGKPRYKFNDEAFVKINEILRAQGLPALPNPYFGSWIANNYDRSRYFASSTPQVTNYGLRIPHRDTDWDYFNLANFHDECGSTYWGRATDHVYLNYQVK